MRSQHRCAKTRAVLTVTHLPNGEVRLDLVKRPGLSPTTVTLPADELREVLECPSHPSDS